MLCVLLTFLHLKNVIGLIKNVNQLKCAKNIINKKSMYPLPLTSPIRKNLKDCLI